MTYLLYHTLANVSIPSTHFFAKNFGFFLEKDGKLIMFNKNEYDKQYHKDNYSFGRVVLQKNIHERIKVIAKEHGISFSALAYESIKEYVKLHYNEDIEDIQS